MSPDTRPQEPEIPTEVLEDVLSAPRRRLVVRTLAERDRPVALSDVAAAVCAGERGTSPSTVPVEDCRAVREDIYQHHLPKLTATGLVEFDSMRGTLQLGPVDVADRVG